MTTAMPANTMASYPAGAHGEVSVLVSPENKQPYMKHQQTQSVLPYQYLAQHTSRTVLQSIEQHVM